MPFQTLEFLTAGVDIHWTGTDIGESIQADAVFHREGDGDVSMCSTFRDS